MLGWWLVGMGAEVAAGRWLVGVAGAADCQCLRRRRAGWQVLTTGASLPIVVIAQNNLLSSPLPPFLLLTAAFPLPPAGLHTSRGSGRTCPARC